MIHPSKFPDIEPVYQLLNGYSFDVDDYPADMVIAGWLDQYGSVWVSHAITEALYQGRYKIVSIDQILQLWQRRGQPIRHFNREFESIILGQTLLYPTGYGDGADSLTGSASGSGFQVLPAQAQDDQQLDALGPRADDAIAPPLAEAPLAGEVSAGEEPAAEEAAIAPQIPVNPFEPAAIATTPTPRPEKIPNFRPLTPALESWPQPDEIQPFVPRHDGSELHQRLRAVVKGGMRD